MKNYQNIIIGLVFLLVLTLALVACGGKTTENTTSEVTTDAPSSTEAPTAPSVERVDVSLKIVDQDQSIIPEAVITIIPADGSSESATLTADSEGTVQVTLPVGEYTVRFDILPEYVLGIDTTLTISTGMEPVILTVTNNKPNGTAERPFAIQEDNVTISIPAGTTYHFTLFGGNNRTLTVENPTAELSYKDTVYVPDENGKISVRMTTENPRDPTFFSLTNKGTEACDMTVLILSDPGAMDNPIPIMNLDEAIVANVPQEGMVYYKWIATATGVLTVSSTDAINNISLNNLTTSQVSSFTEGRESESLSVTEGDEITIVVSILGGDKNAEFNSITFTLKMGE